MASNSLISLDFFTPVEGSLLRVEELMRSQADGYHPDLGTALDHLISSGGKRVRPAVALLIGGMLDGDDERLVTLAAAIEMLHTATLVHDDLIDGAFLRRGIATLNASWTPAATVLTGDYIFARAARLAAQTDSVAVMRLFSETLATIVNGEITQLFHDPSQASRQDYEQRIYAKTASMFELAAVAAGLLSPVDESVIDHLRDFGYAIGMAFQIVDDVLDFTGEQVTVGKPVASDLRQRLVTLPALYYLEAHPDDPDMKKVLGGNHTGDAVMERLVGSICESGAIQQAMDEARAYARRGLGRLGEMPDNTEQRALRDLAMYIVDREL